MTTTTSPNNDNAICTAETTASPPPSHQTLNLPTTQVERMDSMQSPGTTCHLCHLLHLTSPLTNTDCNKHIRQRTWTTMTRYRPRGLVTIDCLHFSYGFNIFSTFSIRSTNPCLVASQVNEGPSTSSPPPPNAISNMDDDEQVTTILTPAPRHHANKYDKNTNTQRQIQQQTPAMNTCNMSQTTNVNMPKPAPVQCQQTD